MHLPDGVLNPTTCIATAVVAAGTVRYALRQTQQELSERAVPLMGVMAACVFAAQMLNFPIPGGTSGHVLGGVLAAVLLGPWPAVLVMTVVLVVQCVLFQDGGFTALGANVVNMALVAPLAGYAIYDLVRRRVGGLRGTLAGAVIAAWFTVMAAATLCSLELSLGGHFRFAPTLGAMLLVHSAIGVPEALVTGMALAFVLKVRPDLVYGQPHSVGVRSSTAQLIAAGLSIALVMAAIASPFASSLPDGLEAALAAQGFDPNAVASVLPAPFAEYSIPALRSLALAGSAAGTIGTLIVFFAAFVMARQWPRSGASSHV